MTKLTEVATPAAVGWRWRSDEGTLFELAWVRGTNGLLLGHYGDDGRWYTTTVDDPGRFLDAPTLKAARVAARRFVDAGS